MGRRTLIYVGLGTLVVVVLAGAGYFLFFHGNGAPAGVGGIFDDVGATSTPISITSGSVVQPPDTKSYRNAAFHFALYYPDDLSVSEQPVGGNSLVVLFKDQARNEGFDVFVTPYDEPKITQQRFEMDEPSGAMQSPQNITVDGAAATEFLSTNSAMGASREIWFLRDGYLYEVTAPQPLDAWLQGIMQTWIFI